MGKTCSTYPPLAHVEINNILWKSMVAYRSEAAKLNTHELLQYMYACNLHGAYEVITKQRIMMILDRK